MEIAVLYGTRLERPEGCPQAVYALMQRCWEKSPEAPIQPFRTPICVAHLGPNLKERINFEQIGVALERIEGMLASMRESGEA